MRVWQVILVITSLSLPGGAFGQALPIFHDFEAPAFTAGPLPQQGWTGDGAIQSTAVFAGTQALQVNMDGMVDRAMISSDPVVYLEGYFRADSLTGGLPDLGGLQPASAILVFMESEGIMTLDGDGSGGGTWTPAGVALSGGGFSRITIRLDYGTQTWDLFVNGNQTPAVSSLGFKDNSVVDLSGLRLKADPTNNSFLDNFSASTTAPDFLQPTLTPTATDTPLPTDTPPPTSTPTLTDTPAPAGTPTPPRDTDGDGILDMNEGGRVPPDNKSNMYLTDSDGDGLMDGYEDRNLNGIWEPATELNPRSRDTDGDGLDDKVEIAFQRSDPLNPFDPPALPDDEDKDGLPDFIDHDPTTNDTDEDRFTDLYEAVQLGPQAPDYGSIYPPLGDVDGNGNWDNADAQLILNFVNAQPTPNFNPDRSDLNLDGKINELDASIALKFYLEEQPVLPAE